MASFNMVAGGVFGGREDGVGQESATQNAVAVAMAQTQIDHICKMCVVPWPVSLNCCTPVCGITETELHHSIPTRCEIKQHTINMKASEMLPMAVMLTMAMFPKRRRIDHDEDEGGACADPTPITITAAAPVPPPAVVAPPMAMANDAAILPCPPKAKRVKRQRYITNVGVRVWIGTRFKICCADCPKQPCFGTEWGKATHCATHKDEGMKNVKDKPCAKYKCDVRPCFGPIGGKAIYCAEHKHDKMENVKDNQCAKDKCTVRPNFGPMGGEAVYCKKHKHDKMVDVTHKQVCAEGKCLTRPIFGTVGGNPTHCVHHKTHDMFDVNHKLCAEDKCRARPTFGTVRGCPTHCVDHKTHDMVDVMNKQCAEDDCLKQPCFGTERMRPTHCYEHRDKKTMFDVTSKLCEEEECPTRASFGTEGGLPTHCVDHKTLDMVNVVSARCSGDECLKSPKFGTVWRKPTHCFTHKDAAMEDVVHERCSRVDVHNGDVFRANFVNPDTGDPLCTFCHHTMFPGSGKTKIRQEESLIEGLRQRLPELEEYMVARDCKIPGGCSLKRPDILYLFDSTTKSPFAFAIECDERGKQHEDCIKRLQLLVRDHGHQAALVLRINPNGRKEEKMLKQFGMDDKTKYYAPTGHFDKLMDQVEAFIQCNVMDVLAKGVVPQPCLDVEDGLAVVKMFF
jgi:hypothetical protein